jgi:hypothetical protein
MLDAQYTALQEQQREQQTCSKVVRAHHACVQVCTNLLLFTLRLLRFWCLRRNGTCTASCCCARHGWCHIITLVPVLLPEYACTPTHHGFLAVIMSCCQVAQPAAGDAVNMGWVLSHRLSGPASYMPLLVLNCMGVWQRRSSAELE